MGARWCRECQGNRYETGNRIDIDVSVGACRAESEDAMEFISHHKNM